MDDLIVFYNKKFGDYVKEISPSQLTVEKANTSDDLANYLDVTFIIESNNRLYTKLFDKHDDFDCRIVNFPFLSSNIPSSPSYGVYISQSHTVHGKSWDHCCACAAVACSDSVFPSMITHSGAVGKGRRCKSVPKFRT